MKLTPTQCQWILDVFTSFCKPIGDLKHPKEIADICYKICNWRDSGAKMDEPKSVDLSEREKDLFLQVAREILAEKHFSYSELPAIAGGSKEDLAKRWGEVAALMGRKL